MPGRLALIALLLRIHGSARAEGRARDKRTEVSADPAAPVGYEETVGRALTEFDLGNGESAALDSDGVLVLPVGDHELEAVADGHRALRRTLHVAGGQRERIDLVLMPALRHQVIADTPRDVRT